MNNLAIQKPTQTQATMFKEEDKRRIRERGIDTDQALNQVLAFKSGFAELTLSKPCVVGDGILQFPQDQAIELKNIFERFSGTTSKFVPASGAATRMFRHLFSFLEKGGSPSKEDKSLSIFFENIYSFAFYDQLEEAFGRIHGLSVEEALSKKMHVEIVKVLLKEKGLNYGNLPKGLLSFHRYTNESRTAAHEQIIEGLLHTSASQHIHIHFTVSPEHLKVFECHLEEKTGKVANGEKARVSFSIQDPATDTIAVDPSNNLFRNESGCIVFRPAGHGALLKNLNQLDEDLVFIKNIDNILPDELKIESSFYKKVLAGLLLKYQEKVFNLLRRNEDNQDITSEAVELLKEMGISGVSKNRIIDKLNRPIRVCGMVENTGEPGGGPFWVEGSAGEVSIQIVEKTQVSKREDQQQVFGKATHFNPVDLVCGIKNYRGEKFDFMNFRDIETGFISEKTFEGKKLKAMELPGLWNGGMSDWNTIFVEVPQFTFSPVKTINDLLKPDHQVSVFKKKLPS